VVPLSGPLTILPPWGALTVVSGVGACVPALQANIRSVDKEITAENRPNAFITAFAFRETKPHLIGDNYLRA
jgi:hypothetical protein